MSSLDEARRRIEERRQQQTQVSGNGLWFRDNDMVICHFICTGGENDPYFDTYVAHEKPASGEGKWPTQTYCPVESGHDGNYDCPGCREGLKTKDRMIMWFWVYDILHAVLKQGESLPQIMYMNKPYFRREVNGPRIWDTSAWRESPLDDIIMLGNQLGNLQAMRMNLMSTGTGLTKRFKIYGEPNTGSIDPACLAAAQETIRPVVEVLRERLITVATVQNPAMQAQPVPTNGQPIQPYIPGGPANIPAYVPGASTTGGAADTGNVTSAGPAIPPKPGAKGKPPKNMF